MQAVAAEQDQDTQVRESRHRVDSSVLDAATRGYLRGQVSLEAYTRFFDEYIEAVERRQRAEMSALASRHVPMLLAQRLKRLSIIGRLIGQTLKRF